MARSTLLTANEKLKKVVVEMVRSIIATEELIGQKISGQDKISTEATHGRRSMGNKESGLKHWYFLKDLLWV